MFFPRQPTNTLLVLGLALSSMACSGAGSSDPANTPQEDAGVDAESDAAPDAPTADAAPDAPTEVTLTFPQALSGAMLANPDVYPDLPLRIVVEGDPDVIRVSISGTNVDASDLDGDGTWEAAIPIASQTDGVLTLSVVAERSGDQVATSSAELRIAREGIQLTDFATDGPAGTPRIHRIGDRMWLTWTDRSSGSPDAWLHEVDGAGRFVGNRVSLIGTTSTEALYARTVPGGDYVGVLFQSLAVPYQTHFRVVDVLGNTVVDTMDLDPPGTNASFGGDITFDGAAFVVAWRVFDASGSQVLWQRIDPSNAQVTGPVVVAESGGDDPIGGFEPFTFVKVATAGPVSLVSFVRGRWISLLDMSIPKAQYARVMQDGTVDGGGYLGSETDFMWHREARVTSMGPSFLLLWSAVDLNDPSTTPPNLFQTLLADAQGELSGEPPTLVFDAVDDRDEPFALPHPDRFATLAWLDHRAYTTEPANGRIELYVAPMNDDLTTEEPTVFPHARFVAGLAQLNGAPLGSNVMLTWVDERHGSGIADPKPEVWLETAWY